MQCDPSSKGVTKCSLHFVPDAIKNGRDFRHTHRGRRDQKRGLCLKCAKELGIKPVEDMMQKMASTTRTWKVSPTEMSAFGGAEGYGGSSPPGGRRSR